MRVAVVVLLLSVLCALPAHAQSSTDASIRITPPDGGEPRTVTLSQLGAPDRPDGWSLSSVLRRAGIFTGAYDWVEVAQAGGAPVRIPIGEIRLTEARVEPSDRANDPTSTLDQRTWTRIRPREHPVVFHADEAGNVTLLRPISLSNSSAVELASVDGTFAVGAVAEQDLEAAPLQARPGETISFRATPPPGTDRSRLTYAWDFGDGARSTGRAEVTHTYASEKTLNVTVTFLLDGAAIGDESVTVYVAAPLRPGSAGDARGGKGDGRRRGRGRARQSEARGGSDGGAGDGGPGGGSGAGPGGENAGADPYAASPPAAYAPVPAPLDSPPAAAEPAPAPAPAPVRPAPGRPAARPAPAPAGEPVSGYLLASATDPPSSGGAGELPDDAPEALAELAREPKQAATNGRSLPTVVWVAAGIVALLALGWALEGRRPLPHWQP
jgi:PKD domain-containing protein